MEPLVISFFYDFNCIADKCSDNCCRSWNLTVDDETLKKYMEEPGREGKALRKSIKRTSSGEYCMRAPFGKCVYQEKDGLCRLQKENRTEHLPKVCRLFPRYTVSYGGVETGVIDLACRPAAELFLKQEGRLKFIPAREKLDIYWDIPEADGKFAGHLLRDLELVLDRIWAAEDYRAFRNAQKDCFIHIYGEHLKLVRNDLEGLLEVPFDKSFLERKYPDEIPWMIKERCKEAFDGLQLLPVSFVNDMLYGWFPELYLFFSHRGAFKLILDYKRYFGKVFESKADEFFSERLEKIFEKNSWLPGKLRSYFSYKLQMLYPGASVDYYMPEPFIMALLFLAVLEVFVITFYEKEKRMDREILSGLIAKTDRLLGHNTTVRGKVMDKVRRELF
ncbi:MAG: flagellin lysine-N-methylase [Lachnospiraceae bacterium]|nr:flagellin lysine-N-methylase [Lachnospiraceae bacterium]